MNYLLRSIPTNWICRVGDRCVGEKFGFSWISTVGRPIGRPRTPNWASAGKNDFLGILLK